MRISIQIKILALIFIALLITLLFVLIFTVNNHRNDLLEENTATLSTTTEQLNLTIRNMMLSGDAPIAVNTMRDLKTISLFNEIDIYRPNGDRAFSDYSTLEEVNKKLVQAGMKPFEKTERLDPKRLYDDNFKQVLDSPTPLPALTEDKQEIHYYFPILNYKSLGCTGCHGEKPFIRGISYINVSTDVYNKINNTRGLLTVFFIGSGIILFAVLIFLIRRLILKPVLDIGKTAQKVGKGDFSARVYIKNNDEVGDLAKTINKMIKNVDERFKLSKYVSKSTNRLISTDSSDDIKEGEKKRLTILFSDIRGFTSYSEKNPPDVVIKNLNKLLQEQAEIVYKYGGDVDKYVGDELMAIFTDDYQAVMCAYEMINKVIQIDKKYNTTLRVGIGVNLGDVISGNIGSKDRMEYAVIGDSVNVAARFCSNAKPDTIIISERIINNHKDKLKAVMIPHQKIKGKEHKIDLYVLSAVFDTKSNKWIEIFTEEEIMNKYIHFPFTNSD